MGRVKVKESYLIGDGYTGVTTGDKSIFLTRLKERVEIGTEIKIVEDKLFTEIEFTSNEAIDSFISYLEKLRK